MIYYFTFTDHERTPRFKHYINKTAAEWAHRSWAKEMIDISPIIEVNEIPYWDNVKALKDRVLGA